MKQTKLGKLIRGSGMEGGGGETSCHITSLTLAGDLNFVHV